MGGAFKADDGKQREYSRAEVAKHSTLESLWVIRGNQVFDLTHFHTDHPGGTDIILEFGGQDITEALRESSIHVHSLQAYRVLGDFYIGEVMSEDRRDYERPESGKDEMECVREHEAGEGDMFLDIHKPLFMQLWNSSFTKDFYIREVHRPRHLPGPAVLFENPVLETLTRTPWWVIPLYWFPIMSVVFALGIKYEPFNVMAVGFVFGLLSWTLMEYCIHRFVFHYDERIPEGMIYQLAHFLLHGFHHFLPMDSLRLVMPPVLSTFLALNILGLLLLVFTPGMVHAIAAGLICGYVGYDECHYWLHHGSTKNKRLAYLKSYHLRHHYKDYKVGFGITSDFWDNIFGTQYDNYDY